KLGNALLGNRQFGAKSSILRPDVAVGRLARRFDVVGALDLQGVAFSHGLSSPSRATRLTRLPPNAWTPTLRSYCKPRQQTSTCLRAIYERIEVEQARITGVATLTEPYHVTLKTPVNTRIMRWPAAYAHCCLRLGFQLGRIF